MPLATLELNPAADPVASLVVLHGLGADGSDFLPVCQALDLRRIGPVRWVLPNAPLRPVTINGGQVMPAWYDIFTPDIGGNRHEDEAGLRASAADVTALLQREVARGVPARRIVLAGFSQGCALALLAGLRFPQRLGGLAGLSGYLPLAGQTAAERHAANADVPVFLAHGTQDDVVQPARGEAARDALLALGQPVQWHRYPMAHSLCQQEVDDLNAWLLQVLADGA